MSPSANKHLSVGFQILHAKDESYTPRQQRTHDYAAVGFCLHGNSRFWMGAAYQLERGMVMLVPEGTPHFQTQLKELTIAGMAICTPCMGPGWGETLVAMLQAVREGGCAVRRLAPDHFDSTVVPVLMRLKAEFDRPTQPRPLVVDGLMSYLVAEAAAGAPMAASRMPLPMSLMVAKALAFIESRATRGVSLEDVGRHVGRSPNHVAAAVKSTTGRTIGQWSTHVRMAAARQLLLHADETIETIAERMGFSSASHFHRTFRRAHGVSPAAWRRTHLAR